MVMKVSSLENSHEMKNIIEMLIEAEEDLCEDAGRLNIEQAYKDACPDRTEFSITDKSRRERHGRDHPAGQPHSHQW